MTPRPSQRCRKDLSTVQSQNCSRGPHAHQDLRPQKRHTNGHWEQQKLFKPRMTNRRSCRDTNTYRQPDSDVTLASISIQSDGNLDYVESREKSPTILDNMPEIAVHIRELEQIHEFAEFELGDFSQPTKIFTHTYQVNPLDIYKDETT